MGDPTNPRDTLFLFVFPCQVSRLTDLPRVINFPLDTPGNETFVPRVETKRQGWNEAGSGASQAWPSVQGTPRLGGLGKGQAAGQQGLPPGGGAWEHLPKGTARADWKGQQSHGRAPRSQGRRWGPRWARLRPACFQQLHRQLRCLKC